MDETKREEGTLHVDRRKLEVDSSRLNWTLWEMCTNKGSGQWGAGGWTVRCDNSKYQQVNRFELNEYRAHSQVLPQILDTGYKNANNGFGNSENVCLLCFYNLIFLVFKEMPHFLNSSQYLLHISPGQQKGNKWWLHYSSINRFRGYNNIVNSLFQRS